MAVCPKCGCKIDYLINVATETSEWTFEVDSCGCCGRYDLIDSVLDGEQIYLCPECRRVLAKNEDEAINFLRGDIIGGNR